MNSASRAVLCVAVLCAALATAACDFYTDCASCTVTAGCGWNVAAKKCELHDGVNDLVLNKTHCACGLLSNCVGCADLDECSWCPARNVCIGASTVPSCVSAVNEPEVCPIVPCSQLTTACNRSDCGYCAMENRVIPTSENSTCLAGRYIASDCNLQALCQKLGGSCSQCSTQPGCAYCETTNTCDLMSLYDVGQCGLPDCDPQSVVQVDQVEDQVLFLNESHTFHVPVNGNAPFNVEFTSDCSGIVMYVSSVSSSPGTDDSQWTNAQTPSKTLVVSGTAQSKLTDGQYHCFVICRSTVCEMNFVVKIVELSKQPDSELVLYIVRFSMGVLIILSLCMTGFRMSKRFRELSRQEEDRPPAEQPRRENQLAPLVKVNSRARQASLGVQNEEHSIMLMDGGDVVQCVVFEGPCGEDGTDQTETLFRLGVRWVEDGVESSPLETCDAVLPLSGPLGQEPTDEGTEDTTDAWMDAMIDEPVLSPALLAILREHVTGGAEMTRARLHQAQRILAIRRMYEEATALEELQHAQRIAAVRYMYANATGVSPYEHDATRAQLEDIILNESSGDRSDTEINPPSTTTARTVGALTDGRQPPAPSKWRRATSSVAPDGGASTSTAMTPSRSTSSGSATGIPLPLPPVQPSTPAPAATPVPLPAPPPPSLPFSVSL